MKEKVNILEVLVNDVSFGEALATVKFAVSSKGQIKVFTPNPEIILKAKKDKEFLGVLRKGDLLIPDGFGLVLFSSLKEVVPGVDFMLAICELAAKENKTIFFFGGRDGSAEKTAKVLKKKFSDLKVSGFSENEKECYNLLEKEKPDILFVALGAPKQEMWISENIEKFPSVKVAMGVGGAFDMISGKVKRAPKFLRSTHLEWLWRLLQEPIRLVRIFNATIIFPANVLTDVVKSKILNLKSKI